MEAGTQDTEVRQTRVGSVPVYWAPTPGASTAGLMFRVGRADERLPLCGITHLVEHLVHTRMDRKPYSFNAWVEGAFTFFVVNGTQEEVCGHLQEVVRMLGDLPLDRLETERRVLSAESNRRDAPDVETRLMAMRFGPVGYGLLYNAEMGVDWVGEEEVRGWAGRHFTAGNAALALNFEPPADFELALPPGERAAPPPVEVVPSLRFPLHHADGTGGVAMTYTVARTSVANAALAIAEERLQKRLRMDAGVSYHPNGSYFPLDDRVAHVMLNADCRDQDAARVQDAMFELLDDLAANGPAEEELEWDRMMFARALQEPNQGMAFAVSNARDTMLGFEPSDVQQLLAERAAVTAEDVAGNVRAAMTSLFALAPEGIAKPGRPGLCAYSPENRDAINGWRYPTTEVWRNFQDNSVLEVSETAVRYEPSGGGLPVGWRFDEIAAGIRELSGSMTIVGRDGCWVKVFPGRYEGGADALAQVRRAIGEERLVPLSAREKALLPVVERDLPRWVIERVEGELDAMAGLLVEDEELRHLAEAKQGEQVGLLVLTDRRLLWIFFGLNRDKLYEHPLDSISLSVKGLVGKKLVVDAGGERTEFKSFQPADRLDEIVRASGRG